MKIDDQFLGELLVQSQDLHADSMRGMPSILDELTDMHLSGERPEVTPAELSAFAARRRTFIQKLGLGGMVTAGLLSGGYATALTAIIAKPVYADRNLDIQILQTATSLEILAIATYAASLGLPFIADGNPVIKAFAQTTMQQHDDHRKAFQAQTEALQGVVQMDPNPKYTPVVEQAKPMLRTPANVVTLAATLEEVATETYLADLTLLDETRAKTIFASIMGVECQHLATLRAVGALLAGTDPGLIAIPTNVAALPAAAGSVAFPEPLQGKDNASPPEEGAVK